MVIFSVQTHKSHSLGYISHQISLFKTHKTPFKHTQLAMLADISHEIPRKKKKTQVCCWVKAWFSSWSSFSRIKRCAKRRCSCASSSSVSSKSSSASWRGGRLLKRCWLDFRGPPERSMKLRGHIYKQHIFTDNMFLCVAYIYIHIYNYVFMCICIRIDIYVCVDTLNKINTSVCMCICI